MAGGYLGAKRDKSPPGIRGEWDALSDLSLIEKLYKSEGYSAAHEVIERGLEKYPDNLVYLLKAVDLLLRKGGFAQAEGVLDYTGEVIAALPEEFFNSEIQDAYNRVAYNLGKNQRVSDDLSAEHIGVGPYFSKDHAHATMKTCGSVYLMVPEDVSGFDLDGVVRVSVEGKRKQNQRQHPWYAGGDEVCALLKPQVEPQF